MALQSLRDVCYQARIDEQPTAPTLSGLFPESATETAVRADFMQELGTVKQKSAHWTYSRTFIARFE